MRQEIVFRSGLVLMLIGLLSACATSPPSSFYTLTAMQEASSDGSRLSAAGRPGSPLAIGLGPVSFPAFLDRPQVVQREGENRLALDEFHRWGGSLDDDFLRVWSENLGLLLGTSRILVFPTEMRMRLDFRVMAEVIAFEAGPGNAAVLRVRWAVLDPDSGSVLEMRDGRYRHPLGVGASVGQQVGALSDVLADFSREVAAVVRELPRPRPRKVDQPGVETSSGGV